MAAGKGTRCFLDLDLGSAEGHQAAAEAYGRAEAFLEENGAAYGLGAGPLSELDQEAKATLRELYEADPRWVERGTCRTEEVKPLRAGRLVVRMLDSGGAPKAVENFVLLCTGAKGAGKDAPRLHYKGTRFHRAVRDFVVQGGDNSKRGDGSGGESAFGRPLKEEKGGLKRKFDRLGLVAMAKRDGGGAKLNSQFFVTLKAELPQLTGKYVVVGEVEEECFPLLDRINAEVARPESEGGPAQDLVVADCGVL